MKKSGFTLAEVLIAVGIIGVMGAIMATTFNNVKPDRTKFLYLKAYDGLKASINAMMYNKNIYSSSYSASVGTTACNIYDTSNFPLLDFAQPIDPNFSGVTGNRYKFANLLRESLNGQGQTCDADGCFFTTKPGNLRWTITNQTDGLTTAPTSGQVYYDINVELQIRRNNDNNTPPSNFLFHVYADGTVRPDNNDDGYTYIVHRTNLRSRNDQHVNSSIPDLSNIPILPTPSTGTLNPDILYYEQILGPCS